MGRESTIVQTDQHSTQVFTSQKITDISFLIAREYRGPSGRKQFWSLAMTQAVGLGFRITGLWPENDSTGKDLPEIRNVSKEFT